MTRAAAVDAKVCVDATFGPPPLQDLLEYADAVIHSATKFFGGHSDVLAGVVSLKSPELLQPLLNVQERSGLFPGELECRLLCHSLPTLPVRVLTATASACLVADFLTTAPHVVRVYHPSLPSHPRQDLAMPGYAVEATTPLTNHKIDRV